MYFELSVLLYCQPVGQGEGKMWGEANETIFPTEAAAVDPVKCRRITAEVAGPPHLSPPLDAQAGLQRTGVVVQAGMNHLGASRCRALPDRPATLAHQHLLARAE